MKTESLRVLMLYPRQFMSLVLTLTCVLLISSIAMAQTPAPPQQTTQQSTTQASPESPPIPERTIGLEPGKVVRWTMRDAILAAYENNVDIQLQTTNVRMAQWDVLSSQGVYDPILTPTLRYGSTSQANTRLFSGIADTSAALTSNSMIYNFQWDHPIEKTGASYQIQFNNQRLINNFQQLSTQYSPSATFSFTQPLFRNFKIDPNRRAIRIAKKNLDISDAQFRQTAIQVIAAVQQAYWNLYVAIENEKIARSALALAEKQMNDNKRQVEVGTLAPINITEAATLVETNRSQVFARMNAVAQAENALKALTTDGPNADLWRAKIETIEKFEAQTYAMPLDDAFKLAKENRPEIRRLTLQKEATQIDIDFLRNQAKPQINFVADYNLFGVGGTPRTSPDIRRPCDPSTTVDIGGQRNCLDIQPVLLADGTYVPQVVPTPYVETPFIFEQPTAPNFRGGYGRALRNMFSNDFRSWSVGINFSLPLRNRVAKANLGRARELDRQNDLLIRQQLQNIEVEVRNQVQAVDTAKLRMESTRQARKYAEEQYEGETKRFQAGLSNTFLVLTRQNDLTRAQFDENSAIADYNIAIAALQRVLAVTLSSNNIQIADPKQPMK
jgi:outer membrane protein TolC